MSAGNARAPTEGFVSRHLNRRLSRPLAAALARTNASPDALTLASLALSLGAAAVTALGWSVAGGVAIQLASVADGVDGDLARLTGRVSRFGAALDAIADRYADAAILGGMTIHAARFESFPRPEAAGALALAAALAVSYSRARAEAAGLWPALAAMRGPLALSRLAGRDARLLAAAIGTALGQCGWTLAALAAAGALTVAVRLFAARRAAAAAP